MYIIMGGTGHVGSAVASSLLARGEKLAVISHDAHHAARSLHKGVEIIEADVNDPASLRAAFRRGRRAFLLNPPADATADTDAVERRTVANILSALDGSGLEKVVAASAGGAQAGDRIGDLSVLWALEQGLRQQQIPAAVNRGGYYMSNWDVQLEAVRTTGKLQAMFPADLAIPMVAPRDLGAFAAQRLVSALDDVGIRHIEGPKRYCAADVAQALSQVLGLPVRVVVTPRDQLKQAFQANGFSERAADAYARMTEVSIDSGFDMPHDAQKGATTLDAYVRDLVARSERK